MSDDTKTVHLTTVHLTDDTFQDALDQAAKDGKPVFVDFYAEWCGPCQLAAPIVDKLAEEMSDQIVIAKLNVDENHKTASEHGVMSIPTVIVFKKNDNGEMEEYERKIGFPGEDGYRQLIEMALED